MLIIMGLRNKLGVLVVILGFSAGTFLTAGAIRNQRTYNRYHALAMHVANTDSVGLTPDVKETATLYCTIGKKYDPTNPEKLTIEDLKTSLHKMGVETDKHGRRIN